MTRIPAEFAQFISTTFRERGKAWLANLPQELAQITQQWRLTLEEPFGNLSYNFVLPVTLPDGQSAVLKAGVPGPEIEREMAALHLYNGRGAARLLAAEPEKGILLLERLVPGTLLHKVVDDDQATRLAAQLMQTLWRPVPEIHRFRPLEQWAQALERPESTAPLPPPLVDKARQLFRELFTSLSTPMILHGDCHHENILLSNEKWKAIDPKGIVGDPYYDPAPFLYNPLGILREANAKKRLNRRLDILAETLDFDRQRLAAYGFCQCLLSAAWSVEDNNDYNYVLHCAKLFDL